MAMACPLRSTGITPASSLIRSSPPLSGASVLSASRLEPLAPCMGLFLSRSFGTPAHLLSFISFFVRSESRSFVPTAQELSRLAVAPTSWHASALARPHLDGFEHDGTLGAIGMTIRGELAFGPRINRATTLYPVGPRTRTMMQP